MNPTMIERDEPLADERTVSPAEQAPEKEFEVGLRPQRLDDFVGQASVKENLKVYCFV